MNMHHLEQTRCQFQNIFSMYIFLGMNIALRKRVWRTGGNSFDNDYGVDGDFIGCDNDLSTPSSFWAVDLGDVFAIGGVLVRKLEANHGA